MKQEFAFGASSYKELIGKPIFDFVHQDDRLEAKERIQLLESETGVLWKCKIVQWLKWMERFLH